MKTQQTLSEIQKSRLVLSFRQERRMSEIIMDSILAPESFTDAVTLFVIYLFY